MDEDIQVIFDDDGLRLRIPGSGGDQKRGYDYVLKPFDVDEINFIIKKMSRQMKRGFSEFLKGKSQDFEGQ